MKLELKNVTHNERLSEETNCFSADLWVDGVKTASVSNRGHGGCDEVHAYEGQRERLEAAEKWAKEQPPIVSEVLSDPTDRSKPFSYQPDLEHFIGEMVTDWLIARDFKKLLKKPAFLGPDGGIYTLQGIKPDDQRVPAYVEKKKAEGVVYLNALPFEEGLAKFRAIGG